MENQKVMNRGLVVVGAILIQLALGAIYAWSVFTPSLVAEGWSKANTQWVFAIGLASFAVFMVFSGKKLSKLGPSKTCHGLVVLVLGSWLFIGWTFWRYQFLGIAIIDWLGWWCRYWYCLCCTYCCWNALVP